MKQLTKPTNEIVTARIIPVIKIAPAHRSLLLVPWLPLVGFVVGLVVLYGWKSLMFDPPALPIFGKMFNVFLPPEDIYYHYYMPVERFTPVLYMSPIWMISLFSLVNVSCWMAGTGSMRLSGIAVIPAAWWVGVVWFLLEARARWFENGRNFYTQSLVVRGDYFIALPFWMAVAGFAVSVALPYVMGSVHRAREKMNEI